MLARFGVPSILRTTLYQGRGKDCTFDGLSPRLLHTIRPVSGVTVRLNVGAASLREPAPLKDSGLGFRVQGDEV